MGVADVGVLDAETDFVFRPDPSTERAEPHRDHGPSVELRLGRTWAQGDGARLLAATRSAVSDRRRLLVWHGGAGGTALALGARAEHPDLHVEEDAPGDVRTVVGWRHWRLREAPCPGELERVMITGGLGGIGLYLATHFVRLGARVWLVDRATPAELEPEAVAALEQLVSSGAATVTTTDLMHPRPTVGATADTVSHVVHAAGTLTPLRLRDMTGPAVDAAARERVRTLHGALALAAGPGLRAVLVCGSIEARRPNPGFGLYAHANEQVRLAAAELARSMPGVRFTVAEWSLWSDVGMAKDHVALARDLGYADVPAPWGAAATVAMLTDPHVPPCLALGGPYRAGGAAVRALGGVAGWAAAGDDDASLGRLARLCDPARGTVTAPGDADAVHALNTGAGLAVWQPERAGWQVPQVVAHRAGAP